MSQQKKKNFFQIAETLHKSIKEESKNKNERELIWGPGSIFFSFLLGLLAYIFAVYTLSLWRDGVYWAWIVFPLAVCLLLVFVSLFILSCKESWIYPKSLWYWIKGKDPEIS